MSLFSRPLSHRATQARVESSWYRGRSPLLNSMFPLHSLSSTHSRRLFIFYGCKSVPSLTLCSLCSFPPLFTPLLCCEFGRLHIHLESLGKRRKLPQWGSGRSSGRNSFYAFSFKRPLLSSEKSYTTMANSINILFEVEWDVDNR